MPSSSIDVKMDSTVFVLVSLSNWRLPLTPVSCRISEKPMVGFFFTTFWMSAACNDARRDEGHRSDTRKLPRI